MRVAIEHGQGTAIVGVGGVALVHGSTDLEVVGLLTDLLSRADPEMEALVDGLVDLGVHELPSFGVVLYGGTESRLMVRGTVSATARTDDGSQHRYDGIRVSTWVEDAAPIDGVTLAIGLVSPPADAYWIESGVVPASALRWGLVTEEPATVAGTAAVVPEPTDEEPPTIEEDPVEPTTVDDDLAPEEQVGAEPLPDDEAGTHSHIADDSSSEPAADYDFTHLVDHTVFRSPGDAVVHREEIERGPDTEVLSLSESSLADGAGPEDEFEVRKDPAAEVTPMATMPPEHTQASSDMISEVPVDLPPDLDAQADVPAPESFDVPGTQEPPGPLGDHDGHTVARRRRSSEPESTVLGPGSAEEGVVLTGVLCSGGHGNSPIAASCMTCGSEIVDHEPRQVQRPALGALRLPSGESLSIDRPIVLGRNPVAVGLINDEVPQNVVIDDELVSRNHAQLILEGWNVLISDLNSTNQTTVILPGQAPRKVSAEESVLIIPGTEIYLGDHGPIVYETNP